MNVLATLIKWVAIAGLAVLATGCATSSTPGDPFEGFNRGVFSFNEGFDQTIVKPIAKGYTAVVPEPARDCVSNVFANIEDIFNGINSLLQGKVVDAGSDAGRLAVNSTVGVLGCFDVASKMGLEKHNRDFGQTFGKWGIGTGPYLVIPFIGVSNLRDGIGNAIYSSLDPVWASHVPTRNVAFSLRLVSRRAASLSASAAVDDAALDKYQFVRDAYLQRRRSMVDDDSSRAGKQ